MSTHLCRLCHVFAERNCFSARVKANSFLFEHLSKQIKALLCDFSITLFNFFTTEDFSRMATAGNIRYSLVNA